MKTPKELDVLRRAVWFDDTNDIVEILRVSGYVKESKHLHKMAIYQKHLIAEVRKLRRELKAKP